MKIDYFCIRSPFKNLDNIVINFDSEKLMTVLVGPNGSGKSNLLEAIVIIFRNLDLGEIPEFSYIIKYLLGSGINKKYVTIDADPKRKQNKGYQISVSNGSATQPISLNVLKRDKSGHSEYLPQYLFAYYSGPSDRLEEIFKKHRTTFYRKLLYSESKLEDNIRPLFYAKPYHSQFVLLAFFLKENETEKQFLKEYLKIDSLDSVHFVFRKPPWAKKKDELFWGASGVVRIFLDKIFPHTIGPLKILRKENTSLTGTTNNSNEFLHLFIPSIEALQQCAHDLSPAVFFKMLESTLLSEIISEVNIRVKIANSDTVLTFKELSEGEQQLLTVLGLLKFTGQDDSLFLLDEPDTHLNPAWAQKYLHFVTTFLPSHEQSHLLLTTHQPFTISDLERSQVQIMNFKDNQVYAQIPDVSPRELGVAGILRSDMFGLKTILGEYATEALEKKRRLAVKDRLNTKEREELKKLNSYLQGIDFTTSIRDPLYRHCVDFLSLLKNNNEFKKEFLDFAQKKGGKEFDILKKIIEGI